MCPQHQIIGVSRSIPRQQDNVEFIQLDWIKGSIHNLPKEQISTVVLIFKPTSSDVSGYQTGFLRHLIKSLIF